MNDKADVLIRRWFEELWNQGREETIDRLLAPGAIVYGLPTPDGRPIRGGEAFKPFYRQFRAAFPDIHVTVERTVTEGDMVAAYCHVKGTHLGDGRERPRPTARWSSMASVLSGLLAASSSKAGTVSTF